MDYAIVPSFGFRNVTELYGLRITLPFNSRHVAELHGLPNDGCQVPRSGHAKVASHQIDGPRMKLGDDKNGIVD